MSAAAFAVWRLRETGSGAEAKAAALRTRGKAPKRQVDRRDGITAFYRGGTKWFLGNIGADEQFGRAWSREAKCEKNGN